MGLYFNVTNLDFDVLELAPLSFCFLVNVNTLVIIRNIIESITNQFRHNSNAFTYGQVLRPVTYIKVDWYWIILPISSVLLAAVVLGTTVFVNYHREPPPWKSALLPLLFYSLGSGGRRIPG
jgi:hypothetical protein